MNGPNEYKEVRFDLYCEEKAQEEFDKIFAQLEDELKEGGSN